MRGVLRLPGQPPKKIRVAASLQHSPTKIESRSVTDWTFGRSKQVKCHATRGSHSGLDQCIVPLLFRGQEVGQVNVHLHHHGRRLSVGATLQVDRVQIRGVG